MDKSRQSTYFSIIKRGMNIKSLKLQKDKAAVITRFYDMLAAKFQI